MSAYSLPQKELFSEHIENAFDKFRRKREPERYQEFVTHVSEWKTVDARWKRNWKTDFYCSSDAHYSILIGSGMRKSFSIGDGHSDDQMIENNDIKAMQEQAYNYLEYAKGLSHIESGVTLELFTPKLDDSNGEPRFKEHSAFHENEKEVFSIQKQMDPEKSAEIKDKIVQHMIAGIQYRNAFDEMIISGAAKKLQDLNKKSVSITPNIARDFPIQPSN